LRKRKVVERLLVEVVMIIRSRGVAGDGGLSPDVWRK
jgi:hypothetical protein